MSDDWPPEGHPPVPPEWEDPEEKFPEGADQVDTEAETRLSAVTAYLASVPPPVLPDAFEARISAAIAAEAAARAETPSPAAEASAATGASSATGTFTAAGASRAGSASPATGASAGASAGTGAFRATGASAATGEPRTLGSAPRRARVARRRAAGRSRQRLRSRSLLAVASVVACLVLAGLGYGLSRGTSGPSRLSPAAGAAAGSSAARDSTAAAGPSYTPQAGAPAAPVPAASAGAGASFRVTASGTGYQRSTLAGQVRVVLSHENTKPSGAEVPGARSATGSASPLYGCVLHLTGGQSPLLVDRATYQGQAAYIVASSSRVWVVGLGCTAAKPELIVSVPLAG